RRAPSPARPPRGGAFRRRRPNASPSALGGLRGGLVARAPVGPAEAVDAAARVDELLRARVERVARRADVHPDLGARRTRREGVPARAVNVTFDVVGMDIGLHGEPAQNASAAL